MRKETWTRKLLGERWCCLLQPVLRTELPATRVCSCDFRWRQLSLRSFKQLRQSGEQLVQGRWCRRHSGWESGHIWVCLFTSVPLLRIVLLCTIMQHPSSHFFFFYELTLGAFLKFKGILLPLRRTLRRELVLHKLRSQDRELNNFMSVTALLLLNSSGVYRFFL